MITLSPQQEKAVRDIGEWYRHESEHKKTFTLGGFAGTGKSTILPDIIEATGLSPSAIAFAAPTGKAAKVMGEKLKQQGINKVPTTIHKLIYLPKMQKAEVLERDLQNLEKEIAMVKEGAIAPPYTGDRDHDLKEMEKKAQVIAKDLDRAYDMNDLRFSLNPDSLLVKEAIELIILDEGSMVGKEVAEDLLDFDIPILVMGDPGQLPPVGDKPGFFIPGELPDAFLTEVHRQAQDNPIIYLATMVRKGKRCDFGDYGDGVLIVPRKKDIYTLDLDRDCQVIVGTNKNRWKQTARMRREGDLLDELPMAGEPLIICKNHKEHPALVNGTQVFATEDHGNAVEGRDRFIANIETEEGGRYNVFTYQGLFEEHIKREKNFATAAKQAAFRSRIRDAHIDFGWAITCHKSQGSQWDEVIVHDESMVFRDDADKWLYTAITRAAQRLVIVA